MLPELRAQAGLLFAGVASFILMGAGQSVYGPALPALARLHAIGVETAGLVVSAHWVGAAVGVAAMFAAGAAFRPVHALVAMALGAGLVAAAPGWVSTLAGAAVFGTGYGLCTVLYNRRFLNGFGPRGPAMVALLNAIFAVGAIGAPVLFLAAGSDPRLFFAGLAVTAGLTIAGARGGSAAAPEAPATTPFRPRSWVLGSAALAIGTEAALIGLGPVALIALGAGEAQAAQLLSAFFVAFLLARLGLVLLVAILPPLVIFALATAGTAALAAALWGSGSVLLFPALGGCAALFFPTAYMTAVATMGDHPRVTPAIVAAGLTGGIAAPLALAPVMAQAGASTLFPLVAVAAGVLALAAGLIAARGSARA
jgi:hypothetical protein